MVLGDVVERPPPELTDLALDPGALGRLNDGQLLPEHDILKGEASSVGGQRVDQVEEVGEKLRFCWMMPGYAA